MRSEVHRFNSDRDSRVKYSTLHPSEMDSPSAASRAIPTNCGEGDCRLGRSGSRRGNADITACVVSPFIRFNEDIKRPSSRQVHERKIASSRWCFDHCLHSPLTAHPLTFCPVAEKLSPARIGAPPVRGKGAGSHPNWFADKTNLHSGLQLS